jgi:addiction module HigA family antidote
MAPKTLKLSITTKENRNMARTPIHPGEILADELSEMEISAAQLARTLRVPANRISQIIVGKRAISADTALRLARYFGTTPDFWMNLQKTYELDLARQSLGSALAHLPQRPVAGLNSQRA